MALAHCPDLTHLGLLIVPTTGVPCGDALRLHAGGRMPELAHGLGFEPSPDGFILPASRHGGFEKAMTAVSRAAVALMPNLRFVAVDPADVVATMRRPANAVQDMEIKANETAHRHQVRSVMAEARRAKPPAPLQPGPEGDAFRATLAMDPLSIVGQALAKLEGGPIEIKDLPHTQDIGDGCVMFARRNGEGVVVGFGLDETDMRRCVTVLCPKVVTAGPAFVALGSGGQFVTPSAQLMVDEMAFAFQTLSDELRGEALVREPLAAQFERELMEYHQRGEITDEQFRENSFHESGEAPDIETVAHRLVGLYEMARANRDLPSPGPDAADEAGAGYGR